NSALGLFIRADITYLKQDFSVPQAVAEPGNWPVHQRYDYFVRVRQVSGVRTPNPKQNEMYRQKKSVIFALPELTGNNRGQRSRDWMEFANNSGQTRVSQ